MSICRFGRGTRRCRTRTTTARETKYAQRQSSEVASDSLLAWTNEERGDGGSVTTVTFEKRGNGTLVVMRDVHANKDALDQAIESGSTGGFGESFSQLDELLAGGR